MPWQAEGVPQVIAKRSLANPRTRLNSVNIKSNAHIEPLQIELYVANEMKDAKSSHKNKKNTRATEHPHGLSHKALANAWAIPRQTQGIH